MAAPRNPVATISRPAGATNIAAAPRYRPQIQPAPPDDHEVLTDFAGALLGSRLVQFGRDRRRQAVAPRLACSRA